MKRFYLLALISVVAALSVRAQNPAEKKVIVQGFWWDYRNDNFPNGWANYLTELAPRLKAMGVDAIWIPPTIKNSGQYVGYAPFDHYDLGDKFQKNSDTTRVGIKDELLRMVAVLHANGIEVIQDIVPNHVIGAGSDNGSGGIDPAAPMAPCTDQWKNFRYVSYATPATDQSASDYLSRQGRFPKNHQNYHPNADHNCGLCDPNSDAWCWQGFGPDVCYYENAHGQSSNAVYNPDQSTYSPYNNGGIGPNNGYMRKHTREWLIWYKKQLGFDGVRIDAVKHFPEEASEDFLFNLQQMSDWASGGDEMPAVGEWVGPKAQLDAWTTQVQGRAGTFDFGLRAFDGSGGLRAMIYGNGGFDLGVLPGAQQNYRYVDIAGVRIHRTVPFINNHDTYRPCLDANGNIIGWKDGTNCDPSCLDQGNCPNDELSQHVDIREPRLGAAYAIITAMDGNPQVFFEDLFNVTNTSKRWTHIPTNLTDLPANSDIANIMLTHGALDFKGGVYKVRSGESGHWNVVTGSNNDDDHLIIERSGKAIIAATDAWDTDQESWIDTDFPPGTVLVDYSGGITTNSVVQGDQRANIKTRAVGYPDFTYSTTYADHGAHYHGYSIWAPQGIDPGAFSHPAVPTTQEWEMDNDLGDSHCQSLRQGGRTPGNSLNPRTVGKIFVAADSTVSFTLYTGSPGTSLTVGFYDLNGNLLHESNTASDSLVGSFVNPVTRWVVMKVRNTANNTAGQKCWLKVTYSAPAVVNTSLYPAASPVSIWTNNGGSNDWNACGNWEEGNVPDCDGMVVIPHPVDQLPVADGCFTGTVTFGYCEPPEVSAPSVVQPTCQSPTGSITINATSLAAMEYSIDNGTTWQSSPEFTGLAPGSYDLLVRLEGQAACTSGYISNPVVLSEATGCCPDQLAVDDDPIPGGTYEAAVEITSMGRVASGSNVVFLTVGDVQLFPNFEVNLGGGFR